MIDLYSKHRRLLLLAIASVLAIALAGCGSDDGTDSSGGSSATTLTKAQFIEAANKICKETDARQARRYTTYLKTHPKDESLAGQEELVTEVGLPAIRTEIAELQELGAPQGDEMEVAAILDRAEEAVEQAEGDPSSVLRKDGGAFAAAERLAKEYGLKACGLV